MIPLTAITFASQTAHVTVSSSASKALVQVLSLRFGCMAGCLSHFQLLGL